MTSILEHLYGDWNRHDTDAVLGHFRSGDIEYRDQALGVVFRTPAELGEFMRATFVAMPDLAFEVTSSFETEEHFAGEAVMTGTFAHDLPGIPATGQAFTVHYGIVGDHRGGLITRLVDYWNATEFTG